MGNNNLLKLLASIPVILIALYFIPVLGIILLLFSEGMYVGERKIARSIYVLIAGIVILIPKGIDIITGFMKINLTNIPYVEDIVKSKIYNNEIIQYSKLLICVGIVFIIIAYAMKNLINRLKSSIMQYFMRKEKRDAEISKQNDMEIKIRQENVKNTAYIECKNCGAETLVQGKFGTCPYCRGKLENTQYKGE